MTILLFIPVRNENIIKNNKIKVNCTDDVLVEASPQTDVHLFFLKPFPEENISRLQNVLLLIKVITYHNIL